MVEFIKNTSNNPLLRNYLKIFSVDVLVKASGIILLPVYLKLMTQEEYGLYGYLLAIISAFSLVFNLGVYTAQSKLYHDYPERRGDTIFTINVLLFVFISSLLFLTLAFDADYAVIAFLFKSSFSYSSYRPFVLLAVVVSVYSLMLTNFFLTSEDLRKVQIYNLLRLLAVNAVVLFVLFIDEQGDNALERLRYTYIVEGVILMIFMGFYWRQMGSKFDWHLAKRALRISLPILFSAVLGLVINLSDRFAIEKFSTLKEMSIYNVALAVAGVIPFIFASFQSVWLPYFLKERDVEANRARAKRMVWRLLLFFLAVSIAILVSLKVLLIFNIIDQKYNEILAVLPIVLATTIIASLTQMYSNHLIYLDKLYLIIVAGIPLSVVAVFLNFKLVPVFDIYGAAVASLIVNASYLIFYSIMVTYYHRKASPAPGGEPSA